MANMDQTMVPMDTTANRTNKLAGAITVWIANTGSRNGWMTSEKFLELLGGIWGPNVDDVRQLLVLDQAPIHKTQAAKDAIQERNTNLVYVPAGWTSLLQPTDVIFEAWASVPEETVAHSLRCCDIANALDGSEEGDLHERLADIGTVVPENPDELTSERSSKYGLSVAFLDMHRSGSALTGDWGGVPTGNVVGVDPDVPGNSVCSYQEELCSKESWFGIDSLGTADNFDPFHVRPSSR
ncbi:hypothetical protein HPB47_020644 [Ixodes persulcatus]|uniref:Uncharacterized protein n=1 Tax=Ixodes persulcatus TaxID=34615 RepID=A0AC60QH11_IXOPE|nr:hypothetical protein HPB47_020644 [Ixodes persulcatus]